MSSIVGTSSPFTALVCDTDRRADERFGQKPLDLLWPRSGVPGAGASGAGVLASAYYEIPRKVASGHTRYNQITFPNGAILSTGALPPGAVVKAFRTLDDVNNSLVADTREGPAVVVAADGSFIISVPNGDQHYLVGYLAGSPDYAGTSVNTLVGT